jgi:adenylate cyclase
MTRAVLGERGFVDKYVGDALMAVFGAPAPTSDHPDRALGAALEMHRQLEVLRATTHAGLDIGVGLNTGEVVAGNMGSEERFDYTVIGDAVNLASRLEGLTKRYGVFCIVGDDTRVRASAGFRFRELDLVRVKGRATPVAVHELLGGPGRTLAQHVDVDGWQQGLTAFRAGLFKDARRHFTAFSERNSSDRVARLYLERLAILGDNAPAGWDGVVDHHEK